MILQDKCGRIVNRLVRKMTRRAATIIFFFSIVSMYLFLALIGKFYQQPWYKYEAPCMTPKLIMDQMVQLTFDVSNLLMKLNISHTLCYGTLWGALRYGKTLPWDNNVDFCVLKNEVEKVSLDTLYEQFKSNKMELVYNIQHGEYIIKRGPAQAYLTVFYTTHLGMAQKDGFQNRFLWFLLGNAVSFPSSLIKPPFTQIMFHGQPMPIPNNDIEILKHLYSEDWWLEEPPRGCPLVKTKSL